MIEKLENGNTLVTLGEGTLYSGLAYTEGEDRPFGIYFSNAKGKSEDAVIIQLHNEKAIASYVMSIVRYVEALAGGESKEHQNLLESIGDIKQLLEPLLPVEKNI